MHSAESSKRLAVGGGYEAATDWPSDSDTVFYDFKGDTMFIKENRELEDLTMSAFVKTSVKSTDMTYYATKPPVSKPRFKLSLLIVPVNVAAAVIVSAMSVFGAGDMVAPTATVGTILLFLTLIPSNLLRFGPFAVRGSRARNFMSTLAKLRAPLGISSGVWFVAHSLISLELFDLAEPLLAQFATADIAMGVVAALVFAAMLTTSTDAWKRMLGKNWKRLQSLVWFAVPLALGHTVLSSLRFNGSIEPLTTTLLAGLVAFTVFELLVLWRRGVARRSAWTHAGLVGAGLAAAVLIYVVL